MCSAARALLGRVMGVAAAGRPSTPLEEVHMSSITKAKLPAALAATLGAFALFAASASASITWFGSSLDHSPANAGSTCAQDGVSGPSTTCTHVGSDYPGFSGRAQSPANGTIVAVQLLPQGPMTMVVKVVNVRNVSSNFKHVQAQAVEKSQTIHVPGPTTNELEDSEIPVETFFVELKVKKGQELAIDTKSNTAEYCSDSTPGQTLFDSVLQIGKPFRSNQGVDGCLMLVRAIVEN
jgi:hypothetical protein